MRQNLGNPALTFVFLITFFMTRKISELVHQKQVDLHVELDEQLVECLGIQWTPFSSLIILPVFFYWRYQAETIIVGMVCWFAPSHWNSKRHAFPLLVQPLVKVDTTSVLLPLPSTSSGH